MSQYPILQNRVLYLCIPILVFLCFSIGGCRKKRDNVDPVPGSIMSFLNNYDSYSADSVDYRKADSVGKIVLSLPNSRVNRGIINEFIMRTEAPRKYSDHLYQYALEDKDSLAMANTFLALGDYYNRYLMSDSSYYYFSQAENLYLQAKDSINLTNIYLKKAILLSKNGVYSEAEKQVLSSVSYNNDSTSLRNRIRQYSAIGDIFSGLGMPDDAIHFYNKALDILNSKELLYYVKPYFVDLNKAYIYDNVARVYVLRGNYTNAKKLLNIAISNHIDFSNRTSERYYAYLALSLADIKIRERELEDVKSLLNQAISIGIKNNNRIIIHNAELGLAEYYYVTNQEDIAKPLLARVRKEVMDIGDFKSQLKALEILISYVDKDSDKHFIEYKEINRLFKKEAHIIRNNFVRIKEEADLLTDANKRLNEKNLLFTLLGGTLVMVLLGVLLLYWYRNKMKKIGLVKMFQRDTEQYYNSIINIQNYLSLAKDRERGIIARELNDSVLNRLFATRFSLLQLEEEQVYMKKDLLINEIVEVETYIRGVAHTLVNEESIKVQGFEQLLRELILVQKKQSEIAFTISIDPLLNLEKLSHRSKINIYRSIQEILLNVHLHSWARYCKVEFVYKSPVLFEIHLIDDGKGFDLRSVKKGYGLTNIRERIEIIGGKLFIISKVGDGTKYLIIINDYQNNDSD